MRVKDLKGLILKHDIPLDTVYFIVHGENGVNQCPVDHWELTMDNRVVCKTELEKVEYTVGDFLNFLEEHHIHDDVELLIETPTHEGLQILSNVKYDKHTGRFETTAH